MASPSPELLLPRSARAERTRQRLLDAAGSCFAESGFAKTTVEEIARTAGVSKGLVYHHFRSKDEVLRAVLDRTLEQWQELTGSPVINGQPAFLPALQRMAHATLRWSRRNPMVLAVLRLDPLVLLAVGIDPVRETMSAFQERLELGLRDAIAKGEIRSDINVPRVAEMLRILHHSFLEQLVEPGWIVSSDDGLIDATFDALFRGLEPRSH
jgi:AcrR family transcriptional regulator